MKNYLLKIAKITIFVFLVFQTRSTFGQIVYTSTPDSIAVLNEPYTYDVNVAATPPSVTFSLVTAPPNMTINSSSGVIDWTPTSLSAGGLVVVKAQNSWGSLNQSYYIYITDAVVCDENMISYWPMDTKVGTTVPEFIHGYNALWEGSPGPEPVLNTDAVAGKSIKFDPTANEDWGYNVTDANQYEFKADSQFSVSFWYKNQPSSIGGLAHDEIFIGRYCGTDPANNNAGWYVGWNATNWKIEFYMRDKGPTQNILASSQEIADNDTEWHHVVASFYPDPANDSYMHLFVDGIETTALYDFWKDDFTGTEDLTLGYYFWATSPFSGLLDEVAVWNKELLPSDVSSLRTKGLAHQAMCAEGNVAPIITSTAITTGTEDVDYSYHFTYRTIGTGATLSAVTLPGWLSFNTSTGILSGTPLNANTGNNTVKLRVSQNGINIDQEFVINVAAVNDPPVFTSTPVISILSLQLYNYWITATDEEGQTLTITCPTKPSWLTFSANAGNGLLTGTPTRDNVGAASVSLQVTDGTNTTTQDFSIEVTLDNHIPVITSTAITSGMIDALYTYTITATDADDDALTYSAPTKPSWLSFNTSTHVLSGIPAQANLGNHNVVLAVTDGKDEVQQSFTINVVVNGINDRIGSLAKVYPVPASNFVILEFAERLDKADLQILNTAGELVKKVDVSNLSTYQLDISDLKSTNYIYRIITSKGQQTGSIVKQ